MEKNILKKVPITGEITLQGWKQSNPLLRIYNTILFNAYKCGLLSRTSLEKRYHKGTPTTRFFKKNVICVAGLSTITAKLVDDYAGTGAITHMALGSGAGTPAETDTELFTEEYRNEVAGKTYSGKVAVLTAFYTESEVDGTFTEFGNFIDGTGVADSGELWSHIAVNWVKPADESLTIQCRYTFSNT